MPTIYINNTKLNLSNKRLGIITNCDQSYALNAKTAFLKMGFRDRKIDLWVYGGTKAKTLKLLWDQLCSDSINNTKPVLNKFIIFCKIKELSIRNDKSQDAKANKQKLSAFKIQFELHYNSHSSNTHEQMHLYYKQKRLNINIPINNNNAQEARFIKSKISDDGLINNIISTKIIEDFEQCQQYDYFVNILTNINNGKINNQTELEAQNEYNNIDKNRQTQIQQCLQNKINQYIVNIKTKIDNGEIQNESQFKTQNQYNRIDNNKQDEIKKYLQEKIQDQINTYIKNLKSKIDNGEIQNEAQLIAPSKYNYLDKDKQDKIKKYLQDRINTYIKNLKSKIDNSKIKNETELRAQNEYNKIDKDKQDEIKKYFAQF